MKGTIAEEEPAPAILHYIFISTALGIALAKAAVNMTELMAFFTRILFQKIDVRGSLRASIES